MPPLTRRVIAELDATDEPREHFVAVMTGLACEALEREWDDVARVAARAADEHLREARAHAVESAAVSGFVEGFSGLLALRFGRTWSDEVPWEWARLAKVDLLPLRDDPTPRRPAVQSASAAGWLAR